MVVEEFGKGVETVVKAEGKFPGVYLCCNEKELLYRGFRRLINTVWSDGNENGKFNKPLHPRRVPRAMCCEGRRTSRYNFLLPFLQVFRRRSDTVPFVSATIYSDHGPYLILRFSGSRDQTRQHTIFFLQS